MKKLLISVLLMLLSNYVSYSQEEPSRFDFKFGTGYTFHGRGDILFLTFDNELNFKISKKLYSSFNLTYARDYFNQSDASFPSHTSFVQGNINIFFAPRSYDKRNVLKIGVGMSLIQIARFHVTQVSRTNTEITDRQFEFETTTTPGINIIVEDNFDITENLIIGVKVCAQEYVDYGIAFVGLVKFGIRL